MSYSQPEAEKAAVEEASKAAMEQASKQTSVEQPAEKASAPPQTGASVQPEPPKVTPTAANGAPQLKNNIVPGFSREKLAQGPSSSGSGGSQPVANGNAPPKPSASKPSVEGPSNAGKPGGAAPGSGAPKPGSSSQQAGQTSKQQGQLATAVAGSSGGGSKPTDAANGKPGAPGPAKPKAAAAAPGAGQANGVNKRKVESDSESEDDVPLNKRVQVTKPPPSKPAPARPQSAKAGSSKAGPSKPAAAKAKPKEGAKAAEAPPKKKRKKEEGGKEQPAKRKKAETRGSKNEDKGTKWNTLKHCGVLFPPEYEAHGVKMLYDGRPVDLTREQEEVATMFASMLETDYMKKDQFMANFWKGFKGVLGSGHTIKSLDKCDFKPIWEHVVAEREAKKALSKEEKVAIKEARDKAEAKYKIADVDGRKEGVGNFRVEPPGLFRGRGEHPKMGLLKRRIYPRDITINIGKGEEIPEHPYPGQKWKEIRHDNTVTWLAFWKDPISTKDYKYVWLAANSVFKSDSDLAKYEKARKLKLHVDSIRAKYTSYWSSKEQRKQQMGVALYFIDKLALRAGHEKDEDEADTVGCCTLKVENVECMDEPANHIKFDFLGKDSIRYENEVEVEEKVWQLVKRFCKKNADGKAKKPDQQLFETMNATDLNTALKELMDGLSVKVFRTYNASITLDRLLHKDSVSSTLEEKKADYDLANKEVAILCNHQRAVPKGHTDQMQRLTDKLTNAQDELDELTLQLKVAQGKAKPSVLKSPTKNVPAEDVILQRIERKKVALGKLQVQSRSKEDLKTVALGTSKINYLDPRITIAWCKRQEVPIEKIFNKSLLSKFHWAMDVEPEFKF